MCTSTAWLLGQMLEMHTNWQQQRQRKEKTIRDQEYAIVIPNNLIVGTYYFFVEQKSKTEAHVSKSDY